MKTAATQSESTLKKIYIPQRPVDFFSYLKEAAHDQKSLFDQRFSEALMLCEKIGIDATTHSKAQEKQSRIWEMERKGKASTEKLNEEEEKLIKSGWQLQESMNKVWALCADELSRAGIVLKVESVVLNKLGIHARPAAMFCKIAERFKAKTVVYSTSGNEMADAVEYMDMMMIAAGPGSRLTIYSFGEDAGTVLKELKALVGRKFEEE